MQWNKELFPILPVDNPTRGKLDEHSHVQWVKHRSITSSLSMSMSNYDTVSPEASGTQSTNKQLVDVLKPQMLHVWNIHLHLGD